MIKRATNGAGPASEFEFDGPSLEDLATEARPLPPSTGSIQKIARAMQIHNFDACRELSRVVMKYKARKRDGQWKDNLSSFARIAVLCDDLLKELRALNPAGKRFLGEARRLESIKIITRLARRTPVKRRKRPNNRPRKNVLAPSARLLGRIWAVFRVERPLRRQVLRWAALEIHTGNGSPLSHYKRTA
jgi:hypothetical protein